MATGDNNNAVTLASANDFLKQWYLGGGGLDRAMYEEDPFLMRIKRTPSTAVTGGNEIIVPIRVGRNPNVTKKFAQAQAGSKTTTGERKKWTLKVDDLHGVVRVENKTIYASQSDRGAFVRLLRDETDDILKRMHERRCAELFMTKANVLATVKSRTGSTVTFNLAHEASRFEIGDNIEFRAPAGSERAGNPYTVTKVDRAGNILTLNKASNAAIVANDECYVVGSYGEQSLTGLPLWIPKLSTAVGTLNGLDRSLDPVRLGGHRLQLTAGGSISSGIRKLCAQINQLTGKNPTIAVCNPLVEDKIAEEQKNNVRYDQANGMGANRSMIGVGLPATSINTAKGPVEIVTSSWAPVETIWVLNESDLALYYVADKGSDFVSFVKNPDGSIYKTSHDSSGIEARLESYGDFAMQSPGLHGRVDLNSADVPSFS